MVRRPDRRQIGAAATGEPDLSYENPRTITLPLEQWTVLVRALDFGVLVCDQRGLRATGSKFRWARRLLLTALPELRTEA